MLCKNLFFNHHKYRAIFVLVSSITYQEMYISSKDGCLEVKMISAEHSSTNGKNKVQAKFSYQKEPHSIVML